MWSFLTLHREHRILKTAMPAPPAQPDLPSDLASLRRLLSEAEEERANLKAEWDRLVVGTPRGKLSAQLGQVEYRILILGMAVRDAEP